jgi:O-acetyl-ADP-ribose deacetylase (regulator of RNase III)
MSFKTIFCDLDRELVKAVHRQADMKGLDGRFQCYFGSFEALERDAAHWKLENMAIANAGNGIGIMGAGIAGAIKKYFGSQVQHDARGQMVHAGGTLPVGSSFVYPAYRQNGEPSRFTHVVYTVTMEQPGTHYSKEESRGLVHHCVLNTLRATGGWNANGMPKIEWLVLPGFGTGIGGIPIEQAARETVLAYKEFFNGS